MSYLAIKHLHVACAVVSGLGFLLRGIWMWRASPHLQHPLTRRLPHVVDSALLGSALTLAAWSGQWPFAQGWLTVKLGGLLLYIVLGAFALRRGRTPAIRRRCFIAALAVYAGIVLTALSRAYW
ncbi:SirB2 family protein [Azonexus sp. R2A61]|uniref:SirB2 family protein n=1 Tax=Azonexus sp. R2A61 TaxID=2744443 RepID=UPI001F3B5E8F|nr:SirB2 family protein [Azonexus sp. R2A61]